MAFEDHVHPHGPLEEVVDGLWAVQGTLGRSPIPRTMAAWRCDGGLVLHSVVALEPAAMKQLEALGEPKVIIVPNRFHRADARVFAERYPDAQVVAPKGARKFVEKVVEVHADAEDVLPDLGVRPLAPGGCKQTELVYDVPVANGRALVMCDLLFNLREHLSGFGGFFSRYITGSTGFFGITRLGKFFLLSDAAALRGWLEDQAGREEIRALIVSHGPPITNCRDMLTQAAGRL